MKREKGSNGNYVCPCCGYATLGEVDEYEICKLCFWEDDGQDNPQEDESWGGPNKLSLSDARINFLNIGAGDPKDLPHVRAPIQSDENIRNYKLANGKVIVNENT
jgi:hypothetical protein